jgi:hypothetical protein
MSTTNSIPGMMYPTQKAMIGPNPRADSIASLTTASQNQNAAVKAVGGRRHRTGKSRRGGADVIAVPQYQMLYDAKGGPGSNPNNQIQNAAQTSTQMSANKVYDNYATKTGGYRINKSKRGGNTNWNWGCLSGGKRRKSRQNRSRKNNSRKNKSSKSRKSRK